MQREHLPMVLVTVHRGLYFVPKLSICPKARQAHDENFYNCPQFAHCAQWNIFKVAHSMPFVGSFFKNDPTKGTKWANFKIFHCTQRANWGQL